MHYIGVPIAMLVMYIAQSIEARLGVAAAGWFAALPVSFAVATASIATINGHGDAAQLALSAAGHVGPQIIYGVVFVITTVRFGMLCGFAISVASYAVASWLIASFSPAVNIGIGVIALVLGNIYQSRRPRALRPSNPATRLQRLLSLGAAGLVVAIIAATNQIAGPQLAGALGAFPVMSTTIAFSVAPREGVMNASTVMAGVARSLPIYLVYGLSFAITLGLTSTLWSVVIAMLCSLTVAALVLRRPNRKALTEDDLVTAEP